MRGGAGSVPEILVSGLEILPYEPSYRDESGMDSGGPDGIVLHCLLYFSCNYSDLSSGSLAFSHLRSQAEISHMNPRRNSCQ